MARSGLKIVGFKATQASKPKPDLCNKLQSAFRDEAQGFGVAVEARRENTL